MADIRQTVITELELKNDEYVRNLERQENAQDKTNEATDEGTEATDQMGGALASVSQELGINVGALSSTLTGLKGVTGGFKTLRVAIAATGIGLLIIALTSLIAFFKRTEEGQEALAVITRVVGEVFNQLAEIAVFVGEIIFNAFKDPQQAVADLWEAIKTNLINRLTGLIDLMGAVGRAIFAAFTFDFDGVADEMGNIATAVVQVGTGLDEIQQQGALDFLANKTAEIAENVRLAGELQKEANALRRDQIEFITREAELTRDIANARLRANDAQLTELEQLDGINEAVQLTNDLFEQRRGFLATQINQLERTQALGSNTLEDNEELARLQAQLINLDTQRDNQLRSLSRRQDTLNNAVNGELEIKNQIIDANNTIQEQEDERNEKAEERLVDIELKEQERQAKEIEDAEEQARVLLDIEFERMSNSLDRQELTEAERQVIIRESQLKQEEILRDSFAQQEAIRQADLQKQIDTQKEIDDTIAQSFRDIAALNQNTAILAATVNIAQGITKAQTLPFPANIAEAARIAIVGAVQIAAIKSASFALGGMIRGPRHSGGGVPINAEGGEVIITRDAVRKHLPLLSAINQDGGGIPLAARGMLVGQAETRAAINNLSSDLDRSFANARPILVTEDLNVVENRVALTESIATF